jgi:uncharacterized protein (TIGR03067 family)
VIKGDRFTAIGMGAEYKGKFEADFTRKPHRLDMNFTAGPEKGNRNLAIFELDGDTWTLCLATRGSKRPAEFASKPGTGIALETLTRRKTSTFRRVNSVAKSANSSTHLEPAPELEGEWAMTSLVSSGEAMERKWAQYGKRVAKGNELTVCMAGQVQVQAKFTVDRSKKPNTIDYLLKNGRRQYGIYELNGKDLKVIFSSPGSERPADFSTAKRDGKTLTIWTLVQQ